jgi:radical SAM protein with 4Fe4S-binding SPASM domain
MLHPLFFEFIEIASGLRLTVSTNGHFLNEYNVARLASSTLSKLIISLDGMDSQTYGRYRINGEFDKVISGIRHLAAEVRRMRSGLKIELQFLVNRYNESQIEQARKFASEANAVLKLKSMQVLDTGRSEYWMPRNERFRRYRTEGDGYMIKSKLENLCSRLWLSPVITWDGYVIPCCFDKDASHIMGDLNEKSFRRIWYGEKYMDFRKKLLSDRAGINICRNCTEGLRRVIV